MGRSGSPAGWLCHWTEKRKARVAGGEKSAAAAPVRLGSDFVSSHWFSRSRRESSPAGPRTSCAHLHRGTA